MAVKSLEQPVKEYIRGATKAFLKGRQSFQWTTGILMNSSLSKETTHRLLLPLRNYGDLYRAETLFTWLDEAEW